MGNQQSQQQQQQQQQQIQIQFLKILDDKNHKQNVLCNLVGDGKLISLTFGDGNYDQQMRDSRFLKFLDKYSDNKIKLITTVGETGEGKSLIQNFMIQQFQNLPHCVEIFTVGRTTRSETKGIKFYYPSNLKEPKYQKEEIVVFFDCEGFDLSAGQDNFHMQNLIKLVCLIANLSTCLVYVHCNTRQKQGFQNILELLNLDKDKNKIPHNNFIEVCNKWNGEDIEAFQSEKLFIKKVFYLRQLNFKNKQIVADENQNDFIQEIKALTEFCKKSNYSNSQSCCQAFEREQTCKNFKEMLTCCFQIIDKQMNCTTELFLEFVNKQQEIKQDHLKSMQTIRDQMKSYLKESFQTLNKNSGESYKSQLLYDLFEVSFQTYYSKQFKKQFDDASKRWYEQFDYAIKSMLERSQQKRQRWLSTEEQNEILEQYRNLDSVKPDEIKIYEKMLKTNTDTKDNKDTYVFGLILQLSSMSVLIGGEFCVAQGLIMMVGIRTLLASLGLAIGALSTIALVAYKIKKSRNIKNMQQSFQKGLLQLIAEDKLVMNSQINLNQIKSIIKSEVPKFEHYISPIQLQEEKDAIYFLVFFNNITSPFDSKKQEQQISESYKIDSKILFWALLQFKQMRNKKISQIQNLKSDPQIIKDEDFNLQESKKNVEIKKLDLFLYFQNLFLDASEDEIQLYKLLFLLKNRNEDLFYKFILHAYFEDYINSEGFAKYMIEKSLIQKSMEVQDRIFSFFSS